MGKRRPEDTYPVVDFDALLRNTHTRAGMLREKLERARRLLKEGSIEQGSLLTLEAASLALILAEDIERICGWRNKRPTSEG